MINLGENCNLDIEKLIATRMLINANSGGGKSWAIRRFLEKSYGQVQQIILDLEGEFISLREKYDYLLVGKEGEIPVSIRTAELLARKLLELNVSTIIDLSELRHPERITFVKRFLDSLVNSPKNLWHPAIIIVDEAHQFCPEKSKSESMGSIIDLMTRGRKRGFCGVLATQRISKLHKDAAAECNNQMVGRTGLDIDMKRAGDILGFTSKEDIRSLRNLKAGEFFVYGSAFENNGVNKIKIGSIRTTHPDRTRGIKATETSPTPESIKDILKNVIDLPKEAEEELKTTEDMKRKIKELKTKLTISEKSKPKNIINKDMIEKARAEGYNHGYNSSQKEFNQFSTQHEKDIRILEKKLLDIGKIVGQEFKKIEIKVSQKKVIPISDNNNNPKPITNPKPIHKTNPREQPLRAGAMKMLGWLAGAYPKELTKQRIATLSGFSVRGGTFNTYLSELKRSGWIVGSNELSITEEGLLNANTREIPSGEELLSLWKAKFRAGAGKILQFLFESYPNEVSKDDIGYATGFEPSGGTFNTYLSELRRNNLIEVNDGIKISDEFFE